MINIIVNYDKDQIEIEGEAPIQFSQLDIARNLIIHLLNKAYYSGETLCLEEKRNNVFSELERWN